MIESNGCYELKIKKESEEALEFIDFVYHMGRRLHEGKILEEDFHRAHNDIRKMLGTDNVIHVARMKEEEEYNTFLIIEFSIRADNTLHEVFISEDGYYLIK